MVDRVLEWMATGEPPRLSSGAQRAVKAACRYFDQFYDEGAGMVRSDLSSEPDPRSTFLSAIALMLSDRPGDRSVGRRLMDNLGNMGNSFDVPLALLVLLAGEGLLDEALRIRLLAAVRCAATSNGEDIIAGRNINIPLATWTGRIGAGVFFRQPGLVGAGARALRQLTDMVEAHGTIPEFNSPTYHPLTLMYLRIISLLGEPETSRLSTRLEEHLWREMAWRFHPRLRQICGPWSRAYQDSLEGGSGMLLMLTDIVWGAFYDEAVAYRFKHAHDHAFGGVLVLLARELPVGFRSTALRKKLPLTVKASAEQVAFRFGSGEHATWVPGGVAELTTWMDEHIAVGTSSRPHIHGLQGAGYVAQWTRTGRVVQRLSDLGQAFTRFVQNGRRPGQQGYVLCENHHLGNPYRAGTNLWPESGLSFALQSGRTAMVVYVPKGQERWRVRRFEGMAVVPRLDTIDEILVDGEPVLEHDGSPESHVLVRSGNASVGMRMACCDRELCDPRLFVERSRDHLFVGLRTADFHMEKELDEHTYRRYGVSMGIEVRYTPTTDDVGSFVRELSGSRIADEWPMAVFGGPREVSFETSQTKLCGRMDPISGTWLRREATKPAGRVKCIQLR